MKVGTHSHIDEDYDDLFAHLKKQTLLLIADDNEGCLTESLSSTTLPTHTTVGPRQSHFAYRRHGHVNLENHMEPNISSTISGTGVFFPRVTSPIPKPKPKRVSGKPREKQYSRREQISKARRHQKVK
ncbi:hypothetical protein NE237_020135 [Protea cynaroides]|uniref:Uncharacterized protein n=1 Tax=Protea cynaroides TaxID=273540 RepID=A0A9Q0H6N4_9MAGN|nr:hypothetical protein NE237_020135 [Protea cynaroides]